MKNAEQFAEFLRCCKEQCVKNIRFAELSLLVNPSAGDFRSIILEFDRCNYLITSNHLMSQSENDDINEFCVKKIEQIDELREYGLTEKDIYKIISAQEHSVTFITEMVDSNGYFDGMEWKYDDGYLFFTVCAPIIAVYAAFDEKLKYMLYSHQFGIDRNPITDNDGYYALFHDA